jgi:hypothetical protein
MFLNTFLYAGVVPFVVAAIIAFVAAQMRAAPRVYWPLSTGLGFIAGYVALKNQSGFLAAISSITHPHESADWLPLIVLLATGVSLLFAQPAYRWVAVALGALLVLAVPLRLLCGNVRLNGEWSVLQKFMYLSLLASMFGVVWILLAYNRSVQPALARLWLVLIDAVGTAVALTISGVLVYGQACGALAAALAGTALASIVTHWRTRPALAKLTATYPANSPNAGLPDAAGIITFSLGSFIILGHFRADLSATSVLLLFVSLAAAGAPLFDGVLRSPVWQQVVVRTIACLIPLAIAVTLSIG